MNKRVLQFMEILKGREETCIVIVSHSAFFRGLYNSDTRLKNCEVAMVAFSDEECRCIDPVEVLLEGGKALLYQSEEGEGDINCYEKSD